jgi:AraC family L-rhamnose operon regulatory protein RhaS
VNYFEQLHDAMAQPVPIFTEHGQTFQADTCRPVVGAVEAGHMRLESLARGSYPGRRLPRSVLPGIRTLGYWDTDHPQDWGLEWHRNEGIELTFLETGSLDFLVESQQFELRPDDLAITRPWQPHRLGNPNIGASRLHWVILDVGVRRPNQSWTWPPWVVLTKADIKQLTNFLRHNEQPVWAVTPDIRRCFGQIGRAVETDEQGSNISRITAYLNELLVLVLEVFRRQKPDLDESLSGTRRTVQLLLNELRRNRSQSAQPWTLQLLAEQCGLGATRFTHVCRQLTNLTPLKYLTQCRVEAAKRLLADEPAMSITEVARVCGFDTNQYFATVFKRHTGQTPSAYRGQGHID